MSKVEAMSVKTLAVSILIGAFCMSCASANAEGENAGAQAEVSQNIEQNKPLTMEAVFQRFGDVKTPDGTMIGALPKKQGDIKIANLFSSDMAANGVTPDNVADCSKLSMFKLAPDGGVTYLSKIWTSAMFEIGLPKSEGGTAAYDPKSAFQKGGSTSPRQCGAIINASFKRLNEEYSLFPELN